MIDEIASPPERAPAIATRPADHATRFIDVCPVCRTPLHGCTCLYDVLDPSAFVWGTIEKWCRPTSSRGRIVLGQDERDELHAEGLAILYRLADIFEPHREGYEHAGRFSGFAAQMLPRKLGDAWHRMHSEHHLVARPEADGGGRQWVYGQAAVSLDAMTAEDPDRHGLLADRPREGDVISRLERELDQWWERQKNVILKVGGVFAEGGTVADAQQICGLTSDQVHAAGAYIANVADRLRTEDT